MKTMTTDKMPGMKPMGSMSPESGMPGGVEMMDGMMGGRSDMTGAKDAADMEGAMMRSSSTRRHAIVAVIVAALLAGWRLFRPELLFVNKRVDEAFPTSAMSGGMMPEMKLATGKFRGLAHETKGMATVYEVDGKRVLRLSDFMTSNGPDVHVLLVAARDAADDATVKDAGFVDLGSLKGNLGDQNYELPADVDLSKYQACTIWCKRFGVNFGTAPLAMP